MKHKQKLIQQVKHKAHVQRNGLYVPRTQGDVKVGWPVCQTCHRDVDSVNVEDMGKESVTIRAKCHGEESVVKLEFPYSIQRRSEKDEWMHIQNAINTCTFFEPSITM